MTQDGLTRCVELEQFQRAALVEMPDFVRGHLMPAAETSLCEDEIDRRQCSTGTALVHRGNLNCRPEYLPIETALGMRPQIQHCDQLSGPRVHRGKSVSNCGKLHQV